MSVSFCGWEVVYDDSTLTSIELEESEKPKDQGVYSMFHGTSIANARTIIANGFQQSRDGMLGPGVYVSRNQKKAERYPLNSHFTDRVVLQLRVHTGRVKCINTDNHPLQKGWHAAGFDTAWVPPNCGMKAVPSGLEEDCVFDPKRVEITGIAKAPNPTIQAELQDLIARSPKRPWTGGNAGTQNQSVSNRCALCKRKAEQGQTHNIQPCWGCNQNICPHMPKHVCSASA